MAAMGSHLRCSIFSIQRGFVSANLLGMERGRTGSSIVDVTPTS
jgi:hypothetical protein